MIRMPSQNPFEERNRAKKVDALIDLIDFIAREQGFDPELDGGVIAKMLRTETTESVWLAMAACIGRGDVGELSKADVIAHYERRAAAANDRVAS